MLGRKFWTIKNFIQLRRERDFSVWAVCVCLVFCIPHTGAKEIKKHLKRVDFVTAAGPPRLDRGSVQHWPDPPHADCQVSSQRDSCGLLWWSEVSHLRLCQVCNGMILWLLSVFVCPAVFFIVPFLVCKTETGGGGWGGIQQWFPSFDRPKM